MITVQVWDRGVVKAVDKAIREAGLGLNPQTEGQTIRVPIPDLNEERRRELTKVAAKYAEQARVSVRNVRRDGIDALKQQEKDGEISQDQHRKLRQGHPDSDRRPHQADRRDARAEGQGNPAGLMSIAVRTCRAPLPRHIAIIMDGNGRWAKARGLPRIAGHRRGAEAVRRTVIGGGRARHPLSHAVRLLLGELEAAARRGRRSDGAAAPLSARRDRRAAPRTACACASSASIGRLPPDIVTLIDNAEALTRDNGGINLTIALSYGGRAEIVAAARAIAAKVAAGRPAVEAIDEDAVRAPSVHRRPARPRSADPHQRRAAHQQFPAVADAPMPSWSSPRRCGPISDAADLEQAIADYHGRERRYGASVGSR